ncbi:MAG: complex I subunit 1 family protein [Thermoplasmata archaeon]
MEPPEEVLLTLLSVALFVLAPFLGMLAMGLGRRISARMQNRVGPPVLQPWYDVAKLMTKSDQSTNPVTGTMAFLFFIFNALAVVVLVTLGDLLMVIVLMGTAQLFLSLAGYAGSSPNSHLGASRNLLQVLSVEPLMLALAVAALLVNGSYFVRELAWSNELLLHFPMAPVVLFFALLVWMQKGPFDLSTAHQEIVYGPMIELSGKNLALVEIGHWFETFGLLAIFSLMFNSAPLLAPLLGSTGAVVLDLVLKTLVAFIVLIAVIWVDNATTRSHWDRLPRFSFTFLWPLVFINILFIYSALVWGWW